MAFVRSIEQIAKKYATVTPGRSEDYRFGVENPRRSWATAAASAESAYEAGVTQAIAKKRFGKGVKMAGDAAWQEGAVQKGTSRWGPGVTLAEPKYRVGFSPYRDAIERTTLPPRYARRDPRNLDRVKAIVNSMVAAKESRMRA